MNIESARASSNRLFQNVIILDEIHRLTNDLLGKLDLTIEGVLKDIKMIKVRCLQADEEFKPFAALRACELEGRYLAMFKKEAEPVGTSGESKVLILPDNGRDIKEIIIKPKGKNKNGSKTKRKKN